MFLVHKLGESIEILAEADSLTVRGPCDLSKRENWPSSSLASAGGWRASREVEQLLELGLAETEGVAVHVPYRNFEAIKNEMPVSLIVDWTPHSPFLLKIDRKSDLGRSDFQYRYTFLLGGSPVHVDRLGYYVKRPSSTDVFLLDFQMYSLIEAMDVFNALSPGEKTPQESWLTFAKVKGCAGEVGATLDSTLRSNDVIVPSALGLDMREDEDGALTFLPKCAELASEEFHQVFERNPGAEKLYSLDRPGLGRVRIVLTDEQHEVLRRMKRVRRVKGDLKARLMQDPVQVFDGIADQIELPYGERVIGIGEFPFAPTPHPNFAESTMAKLWATAADGGTPPLRDRPVTDSPVHGETRDNEGSSQTADSVLSQSTGNDGPDKRPERGEAGPDAGERVPEGKDGRKKFLLIETNEDSVRSGFKSEAEKARVFAGSAPFSRPTSLREDRSLRPHQENGVQWLQTCAQISGRKGVLLADDMGVGKTIQILTFLAWCIESGKFPDLSKKEPPFRPILIVAPLILLDARTWELEMENFFANEGVIFWPVLSLHGDQLAQLRRSDAQGAEVDIGRPVLDLKRIQRNRVVITNYETLKNYQHSFAYMSDGKPLWSFVISDEAQEFKIPNTKISHAIKAIEADLHIACTGTPVENRLLDLWNICDVLQRGLLGSAKDFVSRFEKRGGDGQVDTLPELKKTLLFQQPHAFLLRRTKSEVADLPAKNIVKLDCAMTGDEIAAHQLLLKDIKADTHRSRFLATLHRFAQLYQHPALLSDHAEDWSAPDLVAQSSKLRVLVETLHRIRGNREKVIVFARHRTMQGILAKVLQKEFHLPVRIINGETKSRATSLNACGVKTRNAILQDFRSRPGFNILILSPFVAGIGLTIVEANHVVHYGRWWNPAVESQATDRAYRIGQTKEVSVYLPILRDPSGRVAPTFDERLDVLMEKKQRLAEDFLRPLPPEDEMGGELFTDLRCEAALQS